MQLLFTTWDNTNILSVVLNKSLKIGDVVEIKDQKYYITSQPKTILPSGKKSRFYYCVRAVQEAEITNEVIPLETKANIIADIAILCNIITFPIVVLSMVFEIKYSTIIVFILTIIMVNMKYKYREIRTKEIDQILTGGKDV